MRDIYIYLEGGGDSSDGKATLRRGLHLFLSNVITRARERSQRIRIIACGSIHNTIRDFRLALASHPHALNLLLVDSDAPVTSEPREHLRAKLGGNADQIPADQCHLMAQIMESWLIADIEALTKFYGHSFNRTAIPANPKIEEVRKADVESGLERATKPTQKGEYHKIRHGPTLLATVNPTLVRTAAPHCERFLAHLDREVPP